MGDSGGAEDDAAFELCLGGGGEPLPLEASASPEEDLGEGDPGEGGGGGGAAGAAGPSEDDVANLSGVILAMGMPAAQATFLIMAKAARAERGLGKKQYKALRARVLEAVAAKDLGGTSVRFTDAQSGAPRTVAFVLDLCQRGHDFEKQLAKLRGHVPPEKWADIMGLFSHVLYMGRVCFGATAAKHVGLIREMFGRPADDPCAEFLHYQIDPTNTTLFIRPEWPERVGLFVRELGDAPLSPGRPLA